MEYGLSHPDKYIWSTSFKISGCRCLSATSERAVRYFSYVKIVHLVAVVINSGEMRDRQC